MGSHWAAWQPPRPGCPGILPGKSYLDNSLVALANSAAEGSIGFLPRSAATRPRQRGDGAQLLEGPAGGGRLHCAHGQGPASSVHRLGSLPPLGLWRKKTQPPSQGHRFRAVWPGDEFPITDATGCLQCARCFKEKVSSQQGGHLCFAREQTFHTVQCRCPARGVQDSNTGCLVDPSSAR